MSDGMWGGQAVVYCPDDGWKDGRSWRQKPSFSASISKGPPCILVVNLYCGARLDPVNPGYSCILGYEYPATAKNLYPDRARAK